MASSSLFGNLENNQGIIPNLLDGQFKQMEKVKWLDKNKNVTKRTKV